MNILLPISLDRVRSPISTLLREIACRSPQYDFYSRSLPLDDADRICAQKLWSYSHMHQFKPHDLLLKHYDIVHHASATPANNTAAVCAKMRSFGRVNHILTANCEPYSTDPFLKSYKFSLSRADHIVAVSEAVAAGVADFSGKKVDVVIPNGFDDSLYVLPDSFASNEERPYFLFCAQIIDRKHPEFFIELAESCPEYDFKMIGGHPFPSSSLSKFVKKKINETHNVQHLGIQPREEVVKLMQQATALLFPSDYEGLPLTVVEAMGSGCPVIAQPKSSLGEVITHDENGWLYMNQQKQDWIEKMKELAALQNKERNSVSLSIRESVVERFAWKNIVKDYQAFYNEIS